MRLREVDMTALQVRECPEDVYEGIRRQAGRDKRSIAQETVVMLRESLSLREAVPEREQSEEGPNVCNPLPRGSMIGTPHGVFRLAGARWSAYESKAVRDARIARRREVLDGIRALPPLTVPDGFPSPEQLVREARDAR